MKVILTVIALLTLVISGQGATLYVPGNFSTIQEAIEAAANSDTILVAPGTYHENIDLMEKTVFLISEEGADLTTIRGDQTRSVVTIPGLTKASLSTVLLEGFTITNGKARQGGGIYCPQNNPTIRGCLIVANFTDDGSSAPHEGGDGAGIYCATATIEDCVISQNITGDGAWLADSRAGYGGGIYIESGTPRIENCLISENVTGDAWSTHYGEAGEGGYGGGIFAAESAIPEIVGCVIADNLTGKGGSASSFGAICGEGGFGAGVYCTNATLISCRISGNIAGDGGGSFHAGTMQGDGGCGGGVMGETVTLINCEIVGNSAGMRGSMFGGLPGEHGTGGGVYINYEGVMIHCTVANNASGDPVNAPGGGVHANSGSITSCIVWDNQPDAFNGIFNDVTYSVVQGGFLGEGNIRENPQFVDSANGDYHLAWTSPCINRGTRFEDLPLDDIDGDPRPCSGLPDMGADEFVDLHPLAAETHTFSAGQGGNIDFYFNAGAANGGKSYVILGSATGTTPGTSLPGGMVLRLEWDPITDLIFSHLNTPFFQGFLGKLNGAGQAVAALSLPPQSPDLVGTTFYFAGTLGNPFDFVTNPVPVDFVE